MVAKIPLSRSRLITSLARVSSFSESSLIAIPSLMVIFRVIGNLFRNHRPGRRHGGAGPRRIMGGLWPAIRRASRGGGPPVATAPGRSADAAEVGCMGRGSPGRRERSWPRGRRFRHNRMRIDRLVGSGAPCRTRPRCGRDSPSLLRTRGGGGGISGGLLGIGSLRLRAPARATGAGGASAPLLVRETRLPGPSRRGPADGWLRTAGAGMRSGRRRTATAGTGDHGGRDRSGLPSGRSTGGAGLGCSRRSRRSSGSRGYGT